MGLAAPQLGRPGRQSLAALDRARSALAYGSLIALTAAGVWISVAGADRYSPIVRGSHRGLPDWIVGPLGSVTTARLPFDQFFLIVGLMCAAYLVSIALAGRLRARWLLAAVIALHVAALLAPPLLSSDVFNYVDYGRLGALHGLDPYSHGPIAAPHDPSFRFTGWRHAASAYGPLFTAATYPLAQVSVAAALWVLKAAAALASLGCVALVWRIAGQLGRSRTAATAVFGLNPLLILWTVGGAHNDVLMLLLMLAGVSLALGARDSLGGAALVAAAAVKATAGLAIPLLLIASPRRWRVLAGAAVAGAAVVVLSALVLGGSPFEVVSVLVRQHQLVGYNSAPKELALLFGFPGVTPGVRLVSLVALGGALVWIAWRVWRGADWVAATGWAMVAAVITATWFLAWYAVWPLAFAAVTRDRRLTAATLGLQAFWLLNHVPHLTL